jgi:hypothetical protein
LDEALHAHGRSSGAALKPSCGKYFSGLARLTESFAA